MKRAAEPEPTAGDKKIKADAEPGNNGVAEMAGNATTTQELQACKIGGCCGKNTPKLTTEEVQERMPAVPQWQLSDDGTVISKAFVAKHWKAGMAFLNAVSELAEEEGHHPDLHLTGWRNVRVELSTHAIGGLTLGDFVMAAKIDGVEVEYSPKWLKEQKAKAEGDLNTMNSRQLATS
eukprot:TRINITY_DN38683_c0_g1_i1.p1 TRINITY_DN38683_c0_g1~~TRINITY_DN38683_c0_g1_i1.p1  ORF type:complete len:178 (-),score=54.56 TRINITY_DN38683_c0_g1_i1:352-885(-)